MKKYVFLAIGCEWVRFCKLGDYKKGEPLLP